MDERCSACTAKAKYEVEENYACGRHLGYFVRMHGAFPPYEVKVKVIEIEYED